jgi:hypothetical protein
VHAPERPHRFVHVPDGQPRPWQHWLEEVQVPKKRQGAQCPVASQLRSQQSKPILQTSPVARQPATQAPFVHRCGEGPSQQSLLVLQAAASGLQSQAPEVQLPEQHAAGDEQLASMAPQAGGGTGGVGLPPLLQPDTASASSAADPRAKTVSLLFTTPPPGAAR